MPAKTKRREELESMEQASNKTVRGFRLDDETMESFKRLSEQIGGNQQHVLAELIKTYESQADKATLTSGIEILETFEKYQDMQHDILMTCLKEKQDAVLLAKQDFVKQLESKDKIIQDLQEQLEKVKTELESSLTKIEPLNNQLTEFQNIISEKSQLITKAEADLKAYKAESNTKIEKLSNELEQAKADDKSTRIQYEENVKVVLRLESEIEALKKQEAPLKDNLSKLTGDNKVLNARNEYLEKENEELNREIDSIKASKEAEIELAKKQAALEMKDSMLKEIDKMREETDAIRNKYVKLLEAKTS